MKYLLKISFFVLLGAIWPWSISAEMQCPSITNQYLTIFEKLSNPRPARHNAKTIKTIKWKNHKINLHRLLLQKWEGEDGQKGGLILGVVVLSILTLFFALYGVGFIILAAALGGGAAAVLLSVLAFGLTGLCIFGIARIAKKLHRLKYGETVPEELPRRPPSKPLKPQ